MDVIVKVRDPEENLEEKIKAYKVKKRRQQQFWRLYLP